ncbi:MAG: hypothetical protein WKF89_14380 [Chitinophagaceae bacterium]
MKCITKINCFILSLFFLLTGFNQGIAFGQDQNMIKGSWVFNEGNTDHMVIFADGYYTYSVYNKSEKNYMASSGGTFQVKDKKIITRVEFNDQEPASIGTSNTYPFSIDGKSMNLEINNNPVVLTNIDNGASPLAGTWRITGRMQDGKKTAMTPGARKTLKILSGTRFQWFAINPETKEFFGTGGGTYTFKDGKYTENIEFFPRDSSRVGMSLSFDDKIENGEWHHTGKSSKGDPIYELWSKIK